VFTRSERFYDAVYAWKDYEGESARLHELIQERLPGASTLLDVACGTGSHLVHLAHWYDVEGVDLDPEMLALARDKLPDVALHAGDMTRFDLGRRFDAVTCLFSSIGYAGTLEAVHATVAAMAAHVNPGGVVIVEPWFSPDAWHADRPHLLTVDEPDLKIARMSVARTRDRTSVLDFTYLVATAEGVEVFTEHHEALLLTDDEYRGAFSTAGLAVERDEQGLMGRGLYIGRAPRA